MNKNLPSPEDLRKVLRYDPSTGKLFWLPRPLEMFKTEQAAKTFNSRFAGKEAFTANSHSYRQAHVLGKKVLAHRTAWAIHYGEWPNDQIDHINGMRHDNRIVNLRLASYVDQRRNAAIPCSNTSGVIGVSWHKASRKWRSTITVSNKQIALGYFHNFDDAKLARTKAEIEYGFHANHGRKS